MDLRQLEYFVHVVQLGGFTKAAARLSVAQSALSHHVRQLELELRQPLLRRNGRGVTPTEAGERLLEHARTILSHVTRARDDLLAKRDAPIGNVALGLPASMAPLVAVPLLRECRKLYPNASFGITEGLSLSIVDAVVTGAVDVGLVFNPRPSKSIEIVPLRQVEMYLVGPRPDDLLSGRPRVQARELPAIPLIAPSRANANRVRIESELARLGLRPSIAYEIDGIGSTLDLVREGFGHAVLPFHSLAGYPRHDEITVTPIVNPRLTIQLCVVTPAERPLSPLARGVGQILQRTVRSVFASVR